MFLTIVACLLSYITVIAIRRLYFSRISHVPGPRLAALTYYYQTYWELWPYHGQFPWHCRDLHERYGPIVRIGPDEVHINDPSFFETCYPSSTARHRDRSRIQMGWVQGTGTNGDRSTFLTLDHELHRIRRSMISPFFSKRNVRELELVIAQKLLKLRERLLEYAGKGDIDLNDATGALTIDTISHYCFGSSIGALDQADFAKKYNDVLRDTAKLAPFARTFTALVKAMIKTPAWIFPKDSLLAAAANFQALIHRLTQNAYYEAQYAEIKTDITIIHALLNDNNAPQSEKEFNRIANEIWLLFAAGTEPTARTLATIILHILLNPEIHTRLLNELKPFISSYNDPLPSVTDLESLPYLTAVINEGLRMTHGVAGCLCRIAPHEDLTYGSITIPAGVTFSQTILLHNTSSYFPKPDEFRPQRFLQPEAKRYFYPFGHGLRSCPGMNLAWSELYLGVAALVGGMRIELAQNVTAEDGKVVAEYLIGCLDERRKGVVVEVLGKK